MEWGWRKRAPSNAGSEAVTDKPPTPAPLTAEARAIGVAMVTAKLSDADRDLIRDFIAHQAAEIAANLKREQETVNQLAAARGEIARLEARVAALTNDSFEHVPQEGYVKFHHDGSVRIDLKAYLRSEAGQQRLAAMNALVKP